MARIEVVGLLVAAFVLSAGASMASAASYSEDFTGGVNGWTSNSGFNQHKTDDPDVEHAGGTGSTGALQAFGGAPGTVEPEPTPSNSFRHGFRPAGSPATDALHGNLANNLGGPEIVLSYWTWNFGVVGPETHAQVDISSMGTTFESYGSPSLQPVFLERSGTAAAAGELRAGR